MIVMDCRGFFEITKEVFPCEFPCEIEKRRFLDLILELVRFKCSKCWN